MADNWSSSVVELATPGDWIEWTVTLDSDAADHLNDADGLHLAGVGARGAAITDPNTLPTAGFVILVNDRWALGAGGGFGAAAPWSSAGRFMISAPLTFPSILSYTAPQFESPRGEPDVPQHYDGVDFGPFPDDGSRLWLPGANTIRLVNFGIGADDGEPFDVDAVFIVTNDTVVTNNAQNTADTEPADYDTHVDGDTGGDTEGVVSGGGSTGRLWICKAPDGATGSYDGVTTIDFQKFCNPGDSTKIRLFVHRDGTPATGEVDILQGGYVFSTAVTRLTLVDGIVEFEGDSTESLGHSGEGVSPLTFITYGGSADGSFSPASTATTGIPTVGCGGWHVGNVGTG